MKINDAPRGMLIKMNNKEFAVERVIVCRNDFLGIWETFIELIMLRAKGEQTYLSDEVTISLKDFEKAVANQEKE